ncbi:hypothetical protein [Vagococcus fluvialis]|uniref:hypothetical protein n=1 Tax=Vagococcus fluvialis TaxID=2738 RepID=UPI001D0A278A|nr:hypothetical protein [Vagococcus fluvialis]UDM74012.1 hypothetical protein K5K99_14080 [Vagococcus fluvialis]
MTEKASKEAVRVFYVTKGRNFVGFVHPETRKLVLVDDDKKKITVSAKDTKAIEILESAVDLYEID